MPNGPGGLIRFQFGAMTRGSNLKNGKGLKRAASAPAEIAFKSPERQDDKIVGSKHLVYHREKFPCKLRP